MIAGTARRLAWLERNRQDVAGHVERVCESLGRYVDAADELDAGRASPAEPAPAAVAATEPEAPASTGEPEEPFALAELCRRFALSPFERDIVVMCAAVDLDGRAGSLIAAANGDPARRHPTFGLALAALPGAHWSAVTPDGPLRGWRLVELAGSDVADAGLRLDERILHFLAGAGGLDARLRPILAPVVAAAPPTAGQAAVAPELARALARDGGLARVQVSGADGDARLAVLAAAASSLGATAFALRDADLPAAADDRFELARLCAREWRLGGLLLVLDAAAGGGGEAVAAFAGSLAAPLAVSAGEPLPAMADGGPAFEVPDSTPAERLAQWTAVIGPDSARLNGALTGAVAQFDLPPAAVRVAAGQARRAAVSSGAGEASAETLGDALWEACRRVSRPRLEGLAQRLEALATWDDLVLPEPQLGVLRVIAAQVRQRHRVYEDWGFGARGARGLGISALFTGESGTGKTMAAEVLAGELRLDLYRIDLASVVSKYIGETEKNLKRLFDAAEGSGAILLFDEADALFGKRSEVRDSHDRYANIEVSYLLQRMEAYRGLAILTTNQKQALDPAFLRRIRFIVRFPFPDGASRAAIWRRIFPHRTPVAALDYERLAQLNVAGGHIRNIALAGAFLAADRGADVSMTVLADAARAEYAKLERSLSETETRGWA